MGLVLKSPSKLNIFAAYPIWEEPATLLAARAARRSRGGLGESPRGGRGVALGADLGRPPCQPGHRRTQRRPGGDPEPEPEPSLEPRPAQPRPRTAGGGDTGGTAFPHLPPHPRLPPLRPRRGVPSWAADPAFAPGAAASGGKIGRAHV